jgi:hypothetical protein
MGYEMSRELTSHKVNGLNEALKIIVHGEPGPGGGYAKYHITTVETPPPVGGVALKACSLSDHSDRTRNRSRGTAADPGILPEAKRC